MRIAAHRLAKQFFLTFVAITLIVGLLPLTTLTAFGLADDEQLFMESSFQTGSSVELIPGTYIEGEALAYVVDGYMTTFSLDSTDLLAGAQDIMEIDELCSDVAPSSSSEISVMSASSVDEGLSALTSNRRNIPSGTIKLVRSDSMSTKELIESLLGDQRVLFAEPNYIVQTDAVSNDENNEVESDDEDGEDLAKSGEEDDVDNSDVPTRGNDDPIIDESETLTREEDDEESEADEPAETGKSAEADEPAETGKSAKTNANLSSLSSTETLWGPDDYEGSAANIPSMTKFQWANDNNGELAGTYTVTGNVDIDYPLWNTSPAPTYSEVVVGVVDSGVDASNPDLADVMWTGGGAFSGSGCDKYGYSAVTAEGVTSATGITEFHGTHVAGIIAASWNNIGVSGVAPNVKIMSLRHDNDLSSILECLNYANNAAKAGVNIVATNNSWGLGSCSTDLLNIAFTQLGENGVMSLVAAGNEAANYDDTLGTITLTSQNPYVVSVSSIDPNAALAAYSSYGIGASNVTAGGSTILSAYGNENPDEMQFLGEVNAHAPDESFARMNLVSYTSFDDKNINQLTFTVYGGFGQNPQTINEPEDVGTFDGIAALSVETVRGDEENKGLVYIASNGANVGETGLNLSSYETKPRYVSFRAKCAGANEMASPAVVAFPVKDKQGEGHRALIQSPKGSFGGVGLYCGAYFDLNEGVVTLDDGASVQVGTDDFDNNFEIDWNNFYILIGVLATSTDLTKHDSENDPVDTTVYFDSIALGSGRFPFAYAQGTSMACPEVAGVAAVLAGTRTSTLGEFGTKEFAEKLTALVKASAEPSSTYDNVCSTSGYATVSGSDHLGPALCSVVDGNDSFTVEGYFLSGTDVTLGGESCTYSERSLGNDKYELVVQKPSGFSGGRQILKVSNSGKMDRMLTSFAPAEGAASDPALFDNVDLPLPDGISDWCNYDIAGYAGGIYLLPRATLSSSIPIDAICRFDPSSKSWTALKIPIDEWLDWTDVTGYSDYPLLDEVYDVAACAFGGKLHMLITGANKTNPAFVQNGIMPGIYATLDENGNWERLGDFAAVMTVPLGCTLGSNGTGLYTFGGVINEGGELKFATTVGELKLMPGQEVAKAYMSEPLSGQEGNVVCRSYPRVSYGNGAFVVSGGQRGTGAATGLDPAEGVDIIGIDDGSYVMGKVVLSSSVVGDSPFLQFSSGALDGSFLLSGPIGESGTDTYTLSMEAVVGAYSKSASADYIYSPASVAYQGAYYVLGTVIPDDGGSNGSGARTFSSTSVNTAPLIGDALMGEIEAGAPVVGEGITKFSTSEITVTTQDIYDNFPVSEANEIVAAVNSGNNASVYVSASRLANIPEADKSSITEAAKAVDVKSEDVSSFMDISLFLKVEGSEAVQMHTLQNAMDITLGVPDLPEVAPTVQRSYFVFAYHAEAPADQKSQTIKAAFSATDETLMFPVSRLSTFAIGYKDTESGGSSDSDGDSANPESDASANPESDASTNPESDASPNETILGSMSNTGDKPLFTLIACFVILAICSAVQLYSSRKLLRRG